MSEEQLDEMGPIDYVVLEWAADQPVTGEVMPIETHERRLPEHVRRPRKDVLPASEVNQRGHRRKSDSVCLCHGVEGDPCVCRVQLPGTVMNLHTVGVCGSVERIEAVTFR